MAINHFILATAGHVDHGKSALVKALTGIDPDRLPEEKARGITIDLGFAHLDLAASPTTHQSPLTSHNSPTTLHLGLVDVPGHEDFVKNMVAGVGSIDLAVLVVAADDGWMPQTEEHLQILLYLGVTRAVVALTKLDLAGVKATVVEADVHLRLRDTPFADAPIVKTSVITGQGIEELKATLARLLADAPPPPDLGKPRLPVDRVFTLRGIGTVVTGTLTGGVLRRGQAAVIQPTGRAIRIRSLQSHNREVECSGPGTRTALNLPDVEIGTKGQGGICRGEVITLAELGGAGDTLDVVLEKSSRLINAASSAARPLKNGARVRIHHGSANVPAQVLLSGSEPLAAGHRALAQLRLEAPLFVFAGDRFIVRDWSEQATLAGGIVLDPEAARKNFRAAARQQFLERRAHAPADVMVFAASQLARDRAVRRSALLLKSRFSAAEIAEAASRLAGQNAAALAGDWIVEAAFWTALRRRIGEAIQAGHRAHPERIGLPVTEARRLVEKDLPAAELFDALVAELCRAEYVQAGAVLRHVSHRPVLPAALQGAGARVRAVLAAKPFEPPTRKDLGTDALSQQALRFLIETGEAVDLSEDSVMLAEHFAGAVEAIRKYLREHGTATASELRQLLGTNRRIIIPLLERLDRNGVTVRQGDKRVLKKAE